MKTNKKKFIYRSVVSMLALILLFSFNSDAQDKKEEKKVRIKVENDENKSSNIDTTITYHADIDVDIKSILADLDLDETMKCLEIELKELSESLDEMQISVSIDSISNCMKGHEKKVMVIKKELDDMEEELEEIIELHLDDEDMEDGYTRKVIVTIDEDGDSGSKIEKNIEVEVITKDENGKEVKKVKKEKKNNRK
jgi:hypothetical protein